MATWVPAAGEIEDGTGLSTAIVPEDPADSITALAAEGYTSYAAASAAQQEAYSRKAVRWLEYTLKSMGYHGKRLNPSQGLLFPPRKAYSAEMVHFDADAVPEPFLVAYRLAIEHMAASTWMPGAGTLLIEEYPDAASTARVKMAPGRGSLGANHPEIAMALRECLPPLEMVA